MDKDNSAPNFFGEVLGGTDDNSSCMLDYMFNRNLQQQKQQLSPYGFGATPSFDKMIFEDVMQFADLGPKLALNQARNQEDQETGMDPIYLSKFQVLNEKIGDHNQTQHVMSSHMTSQKGGECGGNIGNVFLEYNDNNSVQLRFIGGGEKEDREKNKNVTSKEVKSKRKRARTSKTVEEVERQRMTHITVERNRRKQMNEQLRVLRSLMPGSYVQRGDQASIIGVVVEFVGELEQLLQCLESQKRRRIFGETGHIGDMTVPTNSSSSPITLVANQTQPLIITENVTEVEFGGGIREETAENKSSLADVEVKLLGFDAMIKILSRSRPGQLIMTIAALEDLDLSILRTNITTMEQNVLYSFNVKITSETRYTAEDIASTIQQVFSFIHENTTT